MVVVFVCLEMMIGGWGESEGTMMIKESVEINQERRCDEGEVGAQLDSSQLTVAVVVVVFSFLLLLYYGQQRTNDDVRREASFFEVVGVCVWRTPTTTRK